MKMFPRNSDFAIYIAVTMDLTVKIISKNEIDIFRGQYHYLLITPNILLPINHIFTWYYNVLFMQSSIKIINLLK